MRTGARSNTRLVGSALLEGVALSATGLDEPGRWADVSFSEEERQTRHGELTVIPRPHLEKTSTLAKVSGSVRVASHFCRDVEEVRRSEGRREGKRKLWLEVRSCPAAAERKEPVCPALPRVPRVFGAGKDRPLHSDWSRGRLFRQGDHREQTGSQSRLLCCSLPLAFPRSLASLSRPRPIRQTTDGQSSFLCAAWQMAS